MKLARLFPIVPMLSACALLATPATGWSGHKKATIYVDNDGDGHAHKKKISIPHSKYSHGSSHSSHYVCPPTYYRPSYPYYSHGPSFGVSITRSYTPRYSQPSYSNDLAVDVQRELRRRGYYRGAIDGDVGPGTRAAIREYQYDRGLSATGRIDSSLLRALGIG
jgi:Putative peptidoglycan binding domain